MTDDERQKRPGEALRSPAVTEKPPPPPMTERIPGPVHIPFPRELGKDLSYDALRKDDGSHPGIDPVRRRAHEATYPSMSTERAAPERPAGPARRPFADDVTLDRNAIASAAEEAAFDTFVRVNLDVTVGRIPPSVALGRYGLTLAQKLELDTRFREKMRTDPALAQRYMRAAAEYALRIAGS